MGADDTAAIDNEGFGDARGAERGLGAFVRVESGVVEARPGRGDEGGGVGGGVAHRDPGDRDPCGVELGELRGLGAARHAPRGEQVDQRDVSGAEVGVAQRRGTGNGGERERGERLADRRRGLRALRPPPAEQRQRETECDRRDDPARAARSGQPTRPTLWSDPATSGGIYFSSCLARTVSAMNTPLAEKRPSVMTPWPSRNRSGTMPV